MGCPRVLSLGHSCFFYILINDLGNVSDVFEMVLFADDTNLLSEWFKAIKLSINIKKSNYMIIKPRKKRLVNDLSITLNGHIIDRVKEVAFLGVILDEHFSSC